MTKQQQTAETQNKAHSRQINKPQTGLDHSSEVASLPDLTGNLIGPVGQATLQAQAAQLNDPRWSAAQRQALAIRLGQVGGNQYLQRVLAAPKLHSYSNGRRVKNNPKRLGPTSRFGPKIESAPGSDSGRHIQPKCACGDTAGPHDECDTCRQNRLALSEVQEMVQPKALSATDTLPGQSPDLQKSRRNGSSALKPAQTVNRSGQIQRAEDGFWDSLAEGASELWDDVSDTASGVAEKLGGAAEWAGEAVGTALGLDKFPMCATSLDANPERPSQDSWLDNTALEAIRHEDKQILSQSQTPKGDSQAATRLAKQALLVWGCEILGLNLLPKYGVNTTFGAETSQAVERFQGKNGLTPDGDIGPNTLEALDGYMQVFRITPPEPSEVGGDDVQGESKAVLKKGFVKATIYFPTDSDLLESDDIATLESLSYHLGFNFKSVSLAVQGFADKRESGEYNENLSYSRAEIVKAELEPMLDDRGISHTVDVSDLGEIERPQPGNTAEELKPFRRVEIWLTASEEEEDLCPPREPDEVEQSKEGKLELTPGKLTASSPDQKEQMHSLTGYAIDSASFAKGGTDIYELLDFLAPDHLEKIRDDNKVETLQVESVRAFGFEDCHEMVDLGGDRAQILALQFPDVMVVGSPMPGPLNTQDTAEGRRANRTVLLKVRWQVADRFEGDEDTCWEFDGGYSDEFLCLAEFLCEAEEPDDWIITKDGAKALNRLTKKACYKEDWPYESANELYNSQLADQIIDDRDNITELNYAKAVAEVLNEMNRGLKALNDDSKKSQASAWGYSDDCSTIVYKLLRDQSKVEWSIYHCIESTFDNLDNPSTF